MQLFNELQTGLLDAFGGSMAVDDKMNDKNRLESRFQFFTFFASLFSVCVALEQIAQPVMYYSLKYQTPVCQQSLFHLHV